MMPTIIDVVEDGLDDVVCLLDFEQQKVINIEDINVTIEDPGYVLEESLDTYKINVPEQYTSSYRKRSFTLPVTFFDISRNITLLTQCRPISIKVVDCGIYPWYYNSDIVIKRKDPNIQLSNAAVELEPLNYKYEEPLKDSSSIQSSSSKINLSLENSQTIAKLIEVVKRSFDKFNEPNSNKVEFIDASEHKNRLTILTASGKNIESDKNFDKYIRPNDLLTCKAIAQTIVCNIDNVGVSSDLDNIVGKKSISIVNHIDLTAENESIYTAKANIEHKTEKSKTNEKSITSPTLPIVCNIDNVGVSCNSDNIIGKKPIVNHIDLCAESKSICGAKANVKNKSEKRKTNEKAITSPILPCKIQKRIRPKENQVRKSTKVNYSLEQCNYSNRYCKHLMFSSDKIIPHYHCNPVPVSNTSSLSNIDMDMNEMMLQNNITQNTALHYIERSKMMNGVPNNPTIGNYSIGNNSFNSVQKRCPMTPNRTSLLDFREASCSNFLLSNWPVTPASSNINSQRVIKNNIKNTNSYALNAKNTFNGNGAMHIGCHSVFCYPSKIMKGNEYGSNIPYPDVNKQNYPVVCKQSSPSCNHSCYQPNFATPLYPINEYASSKIYDPVQMNNRGNMQNIQSNQRFSQLLKYQSNVAPNCYLSTQSYSQTNNLHNTVQKNPIYVCPELATTHASTLSSTLKVNVRDTNSHSVTQNEVKNASNKNATLRKIATSKESKMRCKKVNGNTPTETSNTSTLTNNKSRGLKRSVNKCSRIINENYTELKKILSSKQQCKQFKAHQFNERAGKLNNNIISKTITKKDEYKYRETERVSINANGYSPPILPLPSLEKSLEMMSKSQQLTSSKGTDVFLQNEKKPNTYNLIKKRKNSSVDKKCENVKKISLQEYKKRIVETEKKENVDLATSKEKSSSVNIGNKILCHDASENVDLLDLGYDSDSTVILVYN